MFKKPTSSEKGKKKTVNGKDYYLCEVLKVWGAHTPEECNAKKNNQSEKSDKKQMKFSKSLAALVGELSSFSDEE